VNQDARLTRISGLLLPLKPPNMRLLEGITVALIRAVGFRRPSCAYQKPFPSLIRSETLQHKLSAEQSPHGYLMLTFQIVKC
jgi:hypothetical protein